MDDYGEARLSVGRSSYVLNQYTASGNGIPQPYPIFGPNGEPIPADQFSQRVDSYIRPSETFLAFEVSNVGNSGTGSLWHDDHTHPVTWLVGWQHVLADIEPSRHGRTADYLFADGHVGAIPAIELQCRIERGDNFSLIIREG
jgi:prepilin-type processing-associated H-X9-DG protein